LKEAQRRYELVTKQMLLAIQTDLTEIDYNPMLDDEGLALVYNEDYFDLHKMWLARDQHEFVFQLVYTNYYVSIEGGRSCKLCWRNKYYYEKLASQLWNRVFGSSSEASRDEVLNEAVNK